MPRRLIALVPVVLMLASSLAARAEAPFDFDRTPGKLPKTVAPRAYRIAIEPDLGKLVLTGKEAIDLDVRSATSAIVLNQAGLILASATLETGAAAKIVADEQAQTATLTFAQPVAAGRHTLSIAYSGPILASPNGIYYNDYVTADGSKKRMLVTQFEVSDARRMFPGWDEPAFKATFQLTATLPKTFAAVSNMPIVGSTAAGPTLTRVEFANSPRMSTYLLALLAGELSAVNGESAGVDMSAWAPTGRQAEARYALDAEQQILPFYNTYFDFAYPLPKLDLIAVPGNYSAGAMENWGAITFVDNVMLFDPRASSAATREAIYADVAHEMAHQWSGDLVTMGWWDNIWLNEGFAKWMQNKATDRFNPTWEIWPRQHRDRESAMAQDALSTTHPIQQVIRDESEANTAFDSISYEKGSQVIRMIEDWIGPDVFRDGMRHYIKAHAYSSATSADLWTALSAASRLDVGGVAASFTEQPGIPLVRMSSTCVDGHADVTLTQARFTIHDPAPKAETWRIPLSLGAAGTTARHVLLTAAPVTATFTGCATPIKVNLGENGYYRVQYDAASLQALATAWPTLAAVDRANLLGDQFALFAARRAPLADYLTLLEGVSDDRAIAVWEDTLSHLRTLHESLQGLPEQASLDRFAIGVLRSEFARLGWDAKAGESVPNALLRPRLIAALGRFGDPGIVAQANRRFLAFVAAPASLAPDLRSAVLDIVGHNADQATWETLRDLGVKAPGTEEKLRYFVAMASASDPALIRRNVAFARSGAIQNARIVYFIDAASRSSGKPDLLYSLIAPVAAEIDAKAPGDILPTALASAASGSYNPDTAKALAADPSSNTSNGARIRAARTADAIEANAEFRVRAAKEAGLWLARRGG